MYRFSSGIDTTLTNKHNYNAELLYNSIDALSDVTTDMLTACNSVLTSTTSIIASNLSAYSEVTQPNISSVGQLNSIFDMSFDGVSAETTRINTMNTAIAAEYTMYTGGLQDTSSLSKYVMAAGVDTSLSTKWNSNYSQPKDMLDASTSNMFEGIRKLLEQDSTLTFANTTINTSTTGVQTSDVPTYNWSQLLPKFDTFYCMQKINTEQTVVQVTYKNKDNMVVNGDFDLVNLTFTQNIRVPLSTVAANLSQIYIDVWGSDPDYNLYFEKYVALYNPNTDRFAFITYFSDSEQQPDGEDDDALFVSSTIVDNAGNVLYYYQPSGTGDHLAPDGLYDDSGWSTQTATNEVIFYQSGSTARIVDLWRQESRRTDYERLQKYSTMLTFNFDTPIMSKAGTTTATQSPGTVYDQIGDTTLYTFHNDIFTFVSLFEVHASDNDEYIYMDAQSYDMTTGTRTQLYTGEVGGGSAERVYWSSMKHLNMIAFYVQVYDPGDSNEMRSGVVKIFNDETTSYSSITGDTGDYSTGRLFTTNPQPNGLEVGVYWEHTSTPAFDVKRLVTLDGTVTTPTEFSRAEVTSINDWWEDSSGKVYPFSWTNTTYTPMWRGDYTVTHTAPVTLSNPDVVYTWNKPFINDVFRDEWDNNELITNDYGEVINDSYGFMVAGTSSPTSIDISYTLSGYPLVNFTSDYNFVVTK